MSMDELVRVAPYTVVRDDRNDRVFVVLGEIIGDLRPKAVSMDLLRECLEGATDPAADVARFLPIQMGRHQAAGITILSDGDVPPRPYTHDLIVAAISALAGRVTSAHIHRASGPCVHGRLWVGAAGGELGLDARPSDAIAVAMRVGAPILVEEEVMRYHAVYYRELHGLMGVTVPDQTEAIAV